MYIMVSMIAILNLGALIPIFLTIISLLLLSLLFLNFQEIKNFFKDVNKSTWFFISMLFFLGLFLRIFLLPPLFTTYLDELSYLETGKNILINGKSEVCSYSNYDLKNCRWNDKAVGFSYILAIGFLLMGLDIFTAYSLNALIGSFSIIVVFMLSYTIFKREDVGIYSAFFMCLFPLHIIFSRTIESNASFTLFFTLTLLFFFIYLHNKNLKTKFIALLFLTFAIYIRPDSLLLVPFLFLMEISIITDRKNKLKSKTFWLPWVSALFLIIPVFAQTIFAISDTVFYGKPSPLVPVGGPVVSLTYLREKIDFLYDILKGEYYPFILNLLSIVGIILIIKSWNKKALFFLFILLINSLIFLSYVHLHLRYYLTPLLMIIIFGAFGLSVFIDTLKSKIPFIEKNIHFRLLLTLSIFILVSFFTLPYLQIIQDNPTNLGRTNVMSHKRDRIYYLESETISKIDKSLENRNCYLIMENPLVSGGINRKVVPTDIILENKEIAKKILNEIGCLLYFEDYYCTDYYSLGEVCGLGFPSVEKCEELRKKIVQKCKNMHKEYNLQEYLIFSYNISENIQKEMFRNPKEIKFTLYNVSLLQHLLFKLT